MFRWTWWILDPCLYRVVPRCSLPGRSFVSWSDTSVLRIRWTLYYVHFSVLFLLLSYLFISFSPPPSPTLPDAVAASSHSRKLFEYEPSLETSFQLSASSFSYIYIYIHTLGAMCIIYTHMQDICNNFSFLVHTLHECSTISLTHGNLPTTYSPFVHSVCFSLEIFFFFFSPRFRGKEKTIEGRFDVGPGVNIVRYEIKQDERRFSLSEKRARLDRNNFLPQRKSKGARLDRK